MEIHSSHLPMSDGPPVSAFDTVVDGKSLVVATAVSSNGGQGLNEIGQQSIKAMARHQRAHYPSGMIHVANVPEIEAAHETLSRVFSRASHGDAVVIMGANEHCCDAVVHALNLTELRGFRLQ